MTRICEACGCEFEAITRMPKYCPECACDMFTSPHRKDEPVRKTHVNQKLIDDVRAATQQGLSYGKYKGRG